MRTVRRSADRLVIDLGSARRAGNRAGSAVRGIAVAVVASSLGACSMTFPIAGFKSDPVATGAIDRSAWLLSPALDREDWRRARAALAVTLDPQGNGERAAWQNPQSGAHGEFTAVGPPFPHQDRVCRKFVGELSAGSASGTHVAVSACRDGAGEWALSEQAAAQPS